MRTLRAAILAGQGKPAGCLKTRPRGPLSRARMPSFATARPRYTTRRAGQDCGALRRFRHGSHKRSVDALS